MSFLFCFSFLPTYSSLWFFLFPLLPQALCGWSSSFPPVQPAEGGQWIPLLFIWVVQRPHRNICFPNNHYSQWGPNAPGLSAFVLQFLVASWWLLKQISQVRWQHTGGWRRQDLILISYRSHGLIHFLIHNTLPRLFFTTPFTVTSHVSSIPLSPTSRSFFFSISLFLSVYFTSSPLLIFTIFLMFCHLFSVYVCSNLTPVTEENV